MSKNSFTEEDAKEFIRNLSYKEFSEIVKEYSNKNGRDFSDEMRKLSIADLQARLEELGINNDCPECCDNENVIKSGVRNDIQYYKCKSCNKYFTRFNGTLIEKSHFHWEVWVKVVNMVLNDESILTMKTILENDYNCEKISPHSIWHMQMKIIHALAQIPQPILSGPVEIDETFIRESQKASRELVNPQNIPERRRARYGRKPSYYGIMGPEFANVITAIDHDGYCVIKVASLGKTEDERFEKLFYENIKNASFICTDANNLYKRYCKKHKIPHYVKPSNYLKMLQKNGYQTPYKSDPNCAEIVKKNAKIKKELYDADLIDKIYNIGELKYEDFAQIKNDNSLSLARVNELHSDIKKFLYSEKTNVSTKYLSDYLNFFAFRRNWRIQNCYYPSSMECAEQFLIEILKMQINYTTIDQEKQQIEAPVVSSQYISHLKKASKIARATKGNERFKFGAEDGFDSFNLKKHLTDMPLPRLLDIAKKCKVKQYKALKRSTLVKRILEYPECELIIYADITENINWMRKIFYISATSVLFLEMMIYNKPSGEPI